MDLYMKLLRLKLTPKQLSEYKFPIEDPEDKTRTIVVTSDPETSPINFLSSERSCKRCSKKFQVDNFGRPIVEENCQYHSRAIWSLKFGNRHNCCQGLANSRGCCKAKSHVVDGSHHPLFTKGYVQSQPMPPEKINSFPGIYAIDCEMCETTIGRELIQVSIVDHNGKLFYEKLVKPEYPILDSNTSFHGIEEKEIINAVTTLKDVHNDLLNFIYEETIIIGHSLDNDLKVLKFLHKTIIDSSAVYPHPRGLPVKNSLFYLAKRYGIPYVPNGKNKCKNDALASLILVKKKVCAH